MAITGNPGDLATGGFGTGISGVAATARDVANAVSRGNAMAGGFGGNGGGGGSPIGTGFRGPATTWGSGRSVVPGSLLGRQLASPLSPYGGAFNVTQDELVKAALSNAGLYSTPGNPSLFRLKELAAQTKASPELQGVLGSIQGPFLAGGTPTPIPSGILENALSSSLPAASQISSAAPSITQNTMLDNLQQSSLPDITFSNPTESLAAYGWMFDNPELPIGMRNFNPGNLKYTGSDWQQSNLFGITGPSKYTDQGDPQIQFSDPVSGMASAVRLALAKQSQGMDTVSKIIANPGGWTPGNTAAAKNIAATMGIDPNQKIDLTNPSTMQNFMKALVRQEHGTSSSQYGQDVYNAGINVAFNAYGLGTPKAQDNITQIATKPTTPSGGLLGGSRAESNLVAAAPSPAPVQAVMPSAGLLGGAGREGGQVFAAAPAASTDAFRSANLGAQVLAGAQPQVVEAASAPQAPPINRPTGGTTRLASLLLDRALERGGDRRDRRRKKPSTTTEQTMSDTIGGLLA